MLDQAQVRFEGGELLPAILPLPPALPLLQWYAVYTVARHEKRVAQRMQANGIFGFLPTYRALHRWKDRCQPVELPLFPGYVFVRIALHERLSVLRLPGVAHIVSFQGMPAPLPEAEIEALRLHLAAHKGIEPHPYLKIGRRVRVLNGPMAGVEGILIRKKQKLRVVLSIDLIQSSVALELDSADLEPIY